MSGFCCIAFIEYMLAGIRLLDYTDFLLPNDYKNNDKIICKHFKDEYSRRIKSLLEIEKNWWNQEIIS